MRQVPAKCTKGEQESGGAMDKLQQSRLAEMAEVATVESLVDIAGPELQKILGLDCRRIGGGLGVRMSASPGIPFFTRVFALGIVTPFSGEIIDESVEYLREAGGSILPLQLAPQVETPEALEFLAERGFERGGTWSKMMRSVGLVPEVKTGLRIERVGPEQAADLGQVEIVGMEMPDFMAPWAAAQSTSPGWAGWGAYDGDQMVACGMLFMHEGVAQLSGAATLPSHRGRGAQSALMKVRIEEAQKLGAKWVCSETGSETPENPNPSLHNMYRCGLELLYERRNWLLRL